MHLHAALVSYNRPRLTLIALESFRATVTLPYTLVVVDNASVPSTVEMLTSQALVLALPENRYPGYATNRGWECAPAEATLLQRIDNDVEFLPGWCDAVLRELEAPGVGAVGMAALGDAQWIGNPAWPLGGNMVIRREVRAAGLRFDERPWAKGWVECGKFTSDLHLLGWQHAYVRTPTIRYLHDGDEDYTRATHELRGVPLPDRSGPGWRHV